MKHRWSLGLLSVLLIMNLAGCDLPFLAKLWLSETEKKAVNDIILASTQVSLDGLGLTKEALDGSSYSTQSLESLLGSILNAIASRTSTLVDVAQLLQGGLTGRYDVDMSRTGKERFVKLSDSPTDAAHVRYVNTGDSSLLKNLGFLSPRAEWNWEDRSIRKELRVYGGNSVFAPLPATAWLALTRRDGFGSTLENPTIIKNRFSLSITQEGEVLQIPDDFTIESSSIPNLEVRSRILLDPDPANGLVHLGMKGTFTMRLKTLPGAFDSSFEIPLRPVDVPPGMAFAAGLLERIHALGLL